LNAHSEATPLRPVLAFTSLNSMSAGVVTSGIYFLTKQGWGFSDLHNYLLGCVVGFGYIAGSLAVGPLVSALKRRFDPVTARSSLAAILVLLGASCSLPIVWPGPAAVWVTVAVYSPLIGCVWPVVQGYVSGGRRGPTLSRALGHFSVTWGSSLVVAYCLVAPFCERHGALAILLLGALHVASLWFLRRLPSEPPATRAAAGEVDHPPEYCELLFVFRLLLPLSSLLLNALSPYLPGAFTRLGVPPVWHTVLVTVWLLPRAITFGVLGRSSGWQGRWSTPVLTTFLLAAGFALCLTAPVVASGGPGLWLECVGLVAFGIGMGYVYVAAIYYAQAVGRAEIKAGGKHEALIGAGFLAGPMVGVAACGAVEAGVLAEPWREATILSAVGLIVVAVSAVALRRVRSRTARHR
jgi:MFS family permease